MRNSLARAGGMLLLVMALMPVGGALATEIIANPEVRRVYLGEAF